MYNNVNAQKFYIWRGSLFLLYRFHKMNGLKRLTQKTAMPSLCQLGQVDSLCFHSICVRKWTAPSSLLQLREFDIRRGGRYMFYLFRSGRTHWLQRKQPLPTQEDTLHGGRSDPEHWGLLPGWRLPYQGWLLSPSVPRHFPEGAHWVSLLSQAGRWREEVWILPGHMSGVRLCRWHSLPSVCFCVNWGGLHSVFILSWGWGELVCNHPHTYRSILELRNYLWWLRQQRRWSAPLWEAAFGLRTCVVQGEPRGEMLAEPHGEMLACGYCLTSALRAMQVGHVTAQCGVKDGGLWGSHPAGDPARGPHGSAHKCGVPAACRRLPGLHGRGGSCLERGGDSAPQGGRPSYRSRASAESQVLLVGDFSWCPNMMS